MRINYQELEAQLAGMSNKSILFNLIKQEMKKRNHWKPKPRGKSFAKGNIYAKRSIDK
jgi:hypothetical protein